MGRFSATTPALYNTKRGRGLRRSSRSLRSCVGKEPSLEIYWVTSRNLPLTSLSLSLCLLALSVCLSCLSVLSLSRISSTSVHLNYLRDCTVSEVIEWTDVDGWSVGWSVGWALGWSVGRSHPLSDLLLLVGWAVGRSVSRSVGRLVGWSVGRSACRLV